MATTLKPKTLEEVLAGQKQTTAVTVTPSSTASVNQAKAAENKAAAARREAERQSTPSLSVSIPIPTEPTIELGGPAYFSSKFPGQAFASKSALDSAIATGIIAPGSTYNSTTPTANSTAPKIASPNIQKIESPSINAKTQVGKLVSDFRSTLQTSGGDKDKFYEGINYNSLSTKEKNVADRFFDTQSKKLPPKDLYDTYSDSLQKATDATKAQYEADKKAELADADTSKVEYDTFTTDTANEINSEFNTFQSEQNNLLKNYESNRLNQVQGDLRRALLERGVDISKVPPEQLIALSGSVGAQAFSDISGAKERATTAIENARQNRLAKLQQLRANKVLNDAQYRKQVTTINSTANQAKNNIDLKFAETVFGIKSAQDTKKETTQTNTAQAIMNTAQALGVTGSQFGVVNKFIQNSKTTPEALQSMFAELQNPNSELYAILKSNESASAKQQAFKNQIDLLEAQAKLKSASRSGGSGTIQNTYSGTNQ